jgi:sugar lactone lactonase YvrE
MRALLMALLVCASLDGPASPATRSAPRVETVATFEPAASIQAMDRGADGSLYLTDYAHDKLLKVDPAGHLTTFVEGLSVHPQGILVTATGYLVTGLVNRPSSDPAQTLTQRFKGLDGRLLVLDRHGAVTRSIEIGMDTFPNGMTRLDRRRALIADSLAGRIWVVTPDSGSVASWMDDPLLKASPDFPGANGVKLHRGWVYVTNTTMGRLVRAPIDRDGRPQAAQDFAAAPAADELAIRKDGTVYVAAHARTLCISRDGSTSDAFEGVPGGATLLLTPDGKWLWLATDAPNVNGARGSPSLLRVRLL